MDNKRDAGKVKRRGKGRVSVPDFANLEPRSLTDKQGSIYVAFHLHMARNATDTVMYLS